LRGFKIKFSNSKQKNNNLSRQDRFVLGLLVEARGIEPLSEGASIKASTGLSLVLISPVSLPRAGLKTGQLC